MLVAAVVACGTFGPGDLSRVIAIEVSAPDSLEQYDTLRPHARVLDGNGDSVGATISWSLPDSADSVALTLLDAGSGRTVVNQTGATGRLLAQGDGLVSNPVSIRTLAAADGVFGVGSVVDTVTLSADSVSDSLKVQVVDSVESVGGPSLAVALAGRPVVYAITEPAAPGPVTLITADTAHSLVTTDTVTTAASGIAFVKLRLLGPAVPDSVVVQAVARRAVGDTVPGSPVPFVVRFQP